MSRLECALPRESSTDSTSLAPTLPMADYLPRFRSASAPVVLALLAAASGCAPEQRQAPPPPPVTVTHPVQQDVTVYEVFVGSTEAAQEVYIRARVEGFLQQQHFKTGADVVVGQRLFTIEPVQYQAALDRAEAMVESRTAELARAEADLGRVEQAVATNAVSIQEVDQRRADRDMAEASLAAAKATVINAETQLSYTEIRSPIDGRVGREYVSVGNLVGSGENTLLTTVFSMKPLYVYFEIPEVYIVEWLKDENPREVQPNQFPLSVALAEEEGFPHLGLIEFVENTVNAATGTILVRGVLPNEDGQIYPGLFVRIQVERVKKSLTNALLVEEVSIGTDLAGKYVLVVGADSIVERRGVELGPKVGQLQTVLTGLELDDRYIVDGLVRARPGRPVQAEERR